jgi:hypothetical protein
MKIRVLSFAQCPWWPLHEKAPVLTPPATKKMENAFFYVESQKTLVTKVVGLAKISHLHQKWDHGSIVCKGAPSLNAFS